MLIWTQEQLDEEAVYPRMSYLSTGQLKVIQPEWFFRLFQQLEEALPKGTYT